MSITFISFLFFLLGIVGIIGFMALKKSSGSGTDYFLASQNVSPYLLALSSTASKFSGFMFIGIMGTAYLKGTIVIWMCLGLAIGNIVYAPIISLLQKTNITGWALSVGELMTFWRGENRVWLRRLVGVLTLAFFIVYAAAQFKAGGKALGVAFGQPYYVGIWLCTVVVLFYCWTGGIRASIWTDAAQLIMMFASFILILVMAIIQEGGVGNLIEAFVATAPGTDAVSFIPQNLSIGGYPGFFLYFIGFIALGMGVLGNPHIVIRAMALENPKDAKKFIVTMYSVETLFLFFVVAVGLCTRVILGQLNNFDAEVSLILSAQKILPQVAVGFLLAGIISSALSTADSQIISCSASLMRDLPEPPRDSIFWAKVGTVSIALLAALVAVFAQDSVYTLVTLAFSGLGASIGSVLVLRLLNADISEWGAIAVAVAGATAVVVWYAWELQSYCNEALVGFASAFITYFVIKLFSKKGIVCK